MSQQGGNQFAASGSGTQSFPILPYNPFQPPVTQGGAGTAATPIPDDTGEAPLSDVDFLRLLVQENIPAGGSDEDTMFLNEHLIAILNRSSSIMSYAAYIAWNIKAGALLVLTDRNDGLSEKKLSQAATAAQKQASQWLSIAQADIAQAGRTLAPVGMVFRPYDSSFSDTWNQVWDVTHIDRFYLPWSVIEG